MYKIVGIILVEQIDRKTGGMQIFVDGMVIEGPKGGQYVLNQYCAEYVIKNNIGKTINSGVIMMNLVHNNYATPIIIQGAKNSVHYTVADMLGVSDVYITKAEYTRAQIHDLRNNLSKFNVKDYLRQAGLVVDLHREVLSEY